MKNKLTIALIAANRPNELLECLKYIKNINYKDFELLISDDSADLPQGFETKVKNMFPKAFFINNSPPLGEIKNSNFVMNKASSEYICLFHDDDRMLPEYFDVIIPVMEKNKDISFAYTGRIMVDQENNEIAKHRARRLDLVNLYDANDILNNMIYNQPMPEYRVPMNTPGMVVRKDIFDKVKGFSSKIDTHCDTDFILRALVVSNKVLYVNKPLMLSKVWYGQSGRTSSSRRGVALEAQLGVVDNFISFSKKQGNTKYEKDKINIYKNFAQRCVHSNGPITWIALRYEGSYKNKVKSLLKTTKLLFKLDSKQKYNPKLYIFLMGAILIPQNILKLLQISLLRFYNEKR